MDQNKMGGRRRPPEGGAPGRKRFNKSISASPEEVQAFQDLVDLGVNVYCQMVPSDSKEDVKKFLK